MVQPPSFLKDTPPRLPCGSGLPKVLLLPLDSVPRPPLIPALQDTRSHRSLL